ncbi:MAG: DUF6152 family protein [Steroidobacteraceae bacterium]
MKFEDTGRGRILRGLQSVAAVAAFVALGSVGPASAHHSFAMFDQGKTVTLKGSVREFQWTNPHSWIQLLVSDEQGNTTEWGIELGSPSGLLRQGWTSKSLQPGDKITVTVHPLRDGTPGASFMNATRDDGKPLGRPPEAR